MSVDWDGRTVCEKGGGNAWGGINHRPTRDPADVGPLAAFLSQQVCDAFSYLLRCNSSIEDAIIVAMGKSYVAEVSEATGDVPGNLLRAIGELERSLATVQRIPAAYDLMLRALREMGYEGNPLAPHIMEFRLVEAFSGTILQPDVREDIWREVASRVQADNLLLTFEWEKSLFAELEQPTRDLIDVLKYCHQLAMTEGGKSFVLAVDSNRIPLRQYFARVLSRWLYLLTEFLYGALISTELFYRANGMGTLAEVPAIPKGQPVLEGS